jgi:hypothetical protein
MTRKGLPPALERAQADTDLAAGTNQTSASGMGFTDLLGLHYWFKRIGFNRQILGGPQTVREDAARLQGFAA